MKNRDQSAFTVVELIVVISIIAILATIVTLSFGAWRNSTVANQVKSDLINAASTMESARNFSAGYPLVMPESFVPSTNIEVVVGAAFNDEFCLEAQPVGNTSPDMRYYLYSHLIKEGPKQGVCDDRPNVAPPDAPSDVDAIASTGTSVSMSWPSVSGATSYTAQCARDAAFIHSPKEVSTPSLSGAINVNVTGLTSFSTFFCRAKAINDKGASSWSETISVDTDGSYGSLPVASSIEGYWTTAPQGFLFEDGSAVSRTLYADLFAVIGTTFGSGDGATTFNLPDSRGRTSVNISTTDTEFDVIGERTGSANEQLTIAQIPSHTHQVPYLASGDPSDYLGGSGAAYGMSTSYSSRSGAYNMLEPVGGGATHNNMQPSIVKMAAIKYRAPSGTTSTLPAGTSVQGYWASAPNGYLLENGAAVSRSTYSDLFAVTGTVHGIGNGSTTFNVPDSRGRTSVNLSASDSEFDAIGERSGAKTEQLTIAQIPSHTHQVPFLVSGSDVSDYLGGSAAPYGLSSNYASRSGVYNMLEPVGGNGAHNNIQPSIVKRYAIKHTAAASSLDDSPKGTSIQGYWTSAPSGYLLENGAAVSRSTYAGLFAVIGTTYGSGNGSTTFNVPDSRGQLGVIKNDALGILDEMGEKYGAKSVTLTIAQLPSHTHQVPYLASGDPSDYLGGSAAAYGLSSAYSSRSGAYDMLEPVGGNGAHNNIQPYIVKMFAIKY